MASRLPSRPTAGPGDLLTNLTTFQAECFRAIGESVRVWADVVAPRSAAFSERDAFRKVVASLDDVRPGFEVSYTRTVTDDDIRAFAEATGDHNPLHLDDDYAADTPFERRIVHGFHTGALVSAALARLPGVVVYVTQDLRFLRPVRPGDTVTAHAIVTERGEGKRKCRLDTFCERDGERVLEGEAVVLLLDEPPARARGLHNG